MTLLQNIILPLLLTAMQHWSRCAAAAWPSLLAADATPSASPPATDPLSHGPGQIVPQIVKAVPTFWSALMENAFALSIIFIFLTAIITVLIGQRKRDKCLKLLRTYHVSYLTTTGQVIWGDLIVYSQGLELVFDAPHVNSRKLTKESAMIYDNELPLCLALCRVVQGQTPREKKDRQRQIHASFQPNIFRRSWRALRNLFNTLRDAFGKAFSAALGQLAKVRSQDVILNQQRGSVDQIGQTLISTVGNAYEPMLERHIGKPVVLELACPNAPDKKPIELPGYLVDYSDRFVAVFNVDHQPESVQVLELSESLEAPNYKITLDNEHIHICCTGPDVLIVQWIEAQGVRSDLAIVLISGTTMRMGVPAARPVRIELAVTRKIDIVCPRTMGKVKFGSGGLTVARENWVGRAPEEAEIQKVTPQASTQVTTVTTVSVAQENSGTAAADPSAKSSAEPSAPATPPAPSS